jgi:hypothetical protein
VRVIILSLLCLVTGVVLWIVGAFGASVMTLAFALGFSAAGGLFLFIGYAAARRSVATEGADAAAALGTTGPMGISPVTAVSGNGSAPWAAGAVEPVHGYDDMTATQVTQLVASGALNRQQLAAVLGYEASHQARKTVLDKVEAAVLALAKQETSA